MAARKTPVMQQHAEAKRAYPDAILFFRLGDFYEMFGEDAVLGSRLLDLTLTSRNKGKADEVPMAGVPHHAAHAYIGKLLELGHKVAICEQLADPATVKGIVPRRVVRVITPGTVTDRESLDAATNNWLAAVDVTNVSVGVALLDLSTAELAAADFSDMAAALGELARSEPREVLVGDAADGEQAAQALESLRRALSPQVALRIDPELPAELSEIFGALARDAQLVTPSGCNAAARALRFARACNPGAELPVRRIARWDPSEAVVIDRVAQAHLELVQSVSGSRAATLLGVLDTTKTASGARALRRRLLAPLTRVDRIRRRLDCVELFVVHSRLRELLRRELAAVGDLERLAVRAELGEASPRDLGALRDGLGAAARAVAVLDAIEEPLDREILGLSGAALDVVSDLQSELSAALVERPPAQPKDGGVFQHGFDAELDEYDALKQTGTERMLELEARLRQTAGISGLKVRYTRVFGWYIEVSRAQAAKAPAEWRRKQTVATGERYTTPELDDLADRILHAEERHRERELGLISMLSQRAAQASERVRALSSELARWDVAAALAEVAHRHDYARPEVDDSDVIEICDGRHPVVERLAAAGHFVPNDVRLELGGERLWLVTGPNMAGKSTLLRQVALTAILAQMGSYVPARSARIGIVDRVLSRVGASDDLSRGESTFMVEMRETADILRSATRRSLVILDEIGRGTSTYDGLAIAWAVAEYLDEVIGCRALFATHYHELTELSSRSPHVANFSVSARELEGDIVFLHRLVPGAVSRSFGVAVAKLAGLPEPVLARARAVLAGLEGSPQAEPSPKARLQGRQHQDQLDLFTPAAQPSRADNEVLETLRAVDLNRMTPLEALQLLARLKERL